MSKAELLYPGPETLCNCLWRFQHASGFVPADRIRLRSNGEIEGYQHENERMWRIRDGILVFLAESEVVSTKFDQLSIIGGKLVLSGAFLLRPELEIVLQLVQLDERAPLPDFLSQTKYSLAPQIAALGWEVGDHTYGKPTVYASGPERLIIGRYTSIGGDVIVVLAGHRPDFVSTYPFALLREHWRSVPVGAIDHRGKGDVRIGSDVWLGHGSFLAPGIQIGDGAVVAASSVVTKNVPSYAIVAGNPARIVRYRFNAETIEALTKLRWWDWPDEKVDMFLPYILSSDIDSFIRRANSTNKSD